MSFINPIKNGYLTSKFGWRTHPVTGKKQSWHQGIDIAFQPNSNVPVMASSRGIVKTAGWLGTYGNIVIIEHRINGKHMETLYAHLKTGSTLVKVGQVVEQGQRIATMGNTGSSTAPHLHFEIHNGKWATGQPNAVNPENYIKVYPKGKVPTTPAPKPVTPAPKPVAPKPTTPVKEKEEILLNATGRESARNLIKKGVKEKLFTSPHKDVDKYSDKDLISYALAYVDRKFASLDKK